MPNLMAVIKAIPTVFDFLLNFEYKKFLISCSYIYYYTVFFWFTRVLVYCGLTLINLINSKHTTLVKKTTKRTLSFTIMKFFNNTTLKNNFLKTAAIIYL